MLAGTMFFRYCSSMIVFLLLFHGSFGEGVSLFFCFLVYSPGSSGWPLPLSANVTTANAIATPIAEPNAAISASAMVKIV